MIIAGIDPGKTGALAITYANDTRASLFDVPMIVVRGKPKPAWADWARSWSIALEMHAPDLIVIEDISARPGQGVTSMFTFGRTLGFAHAVAAGCGARVEFVTPSVWKGKLGLLNSDKGASREKARILFPRAAHDFQRVKDDGRAEATLLAHYGRRFLV
jgi:crossover junction endodeoxyribonuclease RuvC